MPRQTAGKREDVIANKGTTCSVFITGNGAEHTDTGFTVCTTNASNFGETGPNSLSLYKTSSAQYFTAGSSVTLYGVKK